ncbi:hypothetical protein L1O48_07530 [Ligilactobacillus equi]|uniref:hypothetical protein n=1 Tax=Ligilactobacillus equi TaxID=137357 RepID=UPI002ED57A7C
MGYNPIGGVLIQQIRARLQQIRETFQQIRANFQQIRVLIQQIRVNFQQIRSIIQQIRVNFQQIRVDNPTNPGEFPTDSGG